ncbi:MAG: YncE family protein [Usitatibacter sp.]
MATRFTHRHLLAIALATLACIAHAAPFAYFTGANSITVVDTQTESVIATIALGGAPKAVGAIPGRRYAYAAGEDKIWAIDTFAQAVTAILPMPAGENSVAMDPRSPRAYVLSMDDSVPLIPITRVVVLGSDIVGQVGSAGYAHVNAKAAAFSPDGTRAYFATADSQVAVIDSQLDHFVANIAVAGPAFVRGVATNAVLGRLYAAMNQYTVPRGRLAVIDLGSETVVGYVTVGMNPSDVVANPAGTRVYVANQDDDTVSVIETGSNLVVATVPVGHQPAAIDITPDGATVYVLSPADGAVSLISTATNTVTKAIHVGSATQAAGRFIGGVIPPGTTGILTGLWWNPAEPGWGMTLTQRNELFFLAWFTYDAAGKAKWYVASSCRMPTLLACPACVANTRCDGALYEMTASRFFGAEFNPNARQATQVGTVSIAFADKDHAQVDYALGGRRDTIAIERDVFAPPVPGYQVDFSELWWTPSEPGWGLAITHQAGTMFLAWFVYDDDGKPAWYVASNCTVNVVDNACSGTLYGTSGPPGPSATSSFDPTRVKTTAVGTVNLSFTNNNTALLTYIVNGVPGFKSISRMNF